MTSLKKSLLGILATPAGLQITGEIPCISCCVCVCVLFPSVGISPVLYDEPLIGTYSNKLCVNILLNLLCPTQWAKFIVHHVIYCQNISMLQLEGQT